MAAVAHVDLRAVRDDRRHRVHAQRNPGAGEARGRGQRGSRGSSPTASPKRRRAETARPARARPRAPPRSAASGHGCSPRAPPSGSTKTVCPLDDVSWTTPGTLPAKSALIGTTKRPVTGRHDRFLDRLDERGRTENRSGTSRAPARAPPRCRAGSARAPATPGRARRRARRWRVDATDERVERRGAARNAPAAPAPPQRARAGRPPARPPPRSRPRGVHRPTRPEPRAARSIAGPRLDDAREREAVVGHDGPHLRGRRLLLADGGQVGDRHERVGARAGRDRSSSPGPRARAPRRSRAPRACARRPRSAARLARSRRCRQRLFQQFLDEDGSALPPLVFMTWPLRNCSTLVLPAR